MILFVIISVISCTEKTIDFEGVGSITGRVVEATSFNSIENAKVVLSPTNNTVFTDTAGYFVFEEVAAGDYSVSSTKDGFLTTFEPATVTIGLDINVVFEMDVETAGNRPPTTPILLSPDDNSSDLDLTVKLVWSSSDPENDTIRYKIKIKNDINDNVDVHEELLDSTFVLSSLTNGTKYFWQVSASDNINDEVWSTVSSFTTTNINNNRYLYVKQIDGNNVIYSTDDEGNERAITNNSENSWRPRKNFNSGKIAFLKLENFETHLYTMNTDGSNVVKISSVPVSGFNQSELDFSWSTNGSKIIYPHFDKLYEINSDGSDIREVYKTSDGSFISECDFSYDGKTIALKTNDTHGYNISIFTIDIGGNIITNILSGVSGAAGGINLSFDGNLLLYTYDVSKSENKDYRQLDTHMFIYNFSLDTHTDISSDKDDGTIDVDPIFSPDQANVMFVNTSNDGISTKNIFTQRVKKETDDGGGNFGRDEKFKDAMMPDWR